MKIVSREYLDKYQDQDYIWYACYGSNINYERFMYYINGDSTERYSAIKGCEDKSLPLEERRYIFGCPIYFAGNSKRWGGGMAFLDYENNGKSYGKIYKIKMSQFKGILEQEQRCKIYDCILLVDYIQDLPVFTFTAKHKLSHLLNEPSETYVDVIRNGLIDLYGEHIKNENITEYLKNK